MEPDSDAVGGPEPPAPPAITRAECLEHFRLFIKNEKSGLRDFYRDDAALDGKAAIGEAMVIQLLADGCGEEVALDLALLTLYDIVMLIDDSSSMRTEQGGSRIETLKATLGAITSVYDLANPQGILSVRFLNTSKGRRNVNEEKAKTLLDDHVYRGVTRIGTELERKILNRFIWNPKDPPKKPLLVMIVTDGAAEGEKQDHLVEVIVDFFTKLKERERDRLNQHAVAFHFACVGDDKGAEELLRRLDIHKQVGKYVDCLPMAVPLEKVSDRDYKWIVLPKLLVGAIIRDWDKQDKPLGRELELSDGAADGEGSDDSDDD